MGEHVPDADRGVSADAACVYDHSSGSTAVTIVSMDRETSNYFLYLETWDGTTFEFERLNYDVGIGTGDAALLLKCTADRVFFWAGTVLNSDSRGIRPQSILTLPMYAPSHSFSGTEWDIDPVEVILPGNHEATQPANDEFGRVFDVTRDGAILVASYPGATAYGNAVRGSHLPVPPRVCVGQHSECQGRECRGHLGCPHRVHRPFPGSRLGLRQELLHHAVHHQN